MGNGRSAPGLHTLPVSGIPLRRSSPRALFLRRLLAAGLAVILVPVGGCSRTQQAGTAVGAAGGTVTSADSSVRVVFAPGQADDGARVSVSTDGDGPPPPMAVDPLTRPFDIRAERGTIRSGAVTVHFGELPQGITAASVRLFIDDAGNGWQALPTTIDQTAGTATATFPHFTKGFLRHGQRLGRFRRQGHAEGADLSDLLATMTWSRWDRVVVPGGNQTLVTLTSVFRYQSIMAPESGFLIFARVGGPRGRAGVPARWPVSSGWCRRDRVRVSAGRAW